MGAPAVPAPAPFNPKNSTPATSFLGVSELRKARAALARVRAGTGEMTVAMIGDSTTAGVGAGVNTVATYSGNARFKSAPEYLKSILAGGDLAVRGDAIWGNAAISGGLPVNQTIADYALYNTQTTFGAGWTLLAAYSLGGAPFRNNSTTNAMVFTPTLAADTFDIYYLRTTGGATFTVTDASGTLATVNSNGADLVIRQTVTRAVASTAPISIQRNGTGADCYIVSIVPKNSTLPAVHIMNMGVGGSTSTDWVSTSSYYKSRTVLGMLQPDLTFINLGLNDLSASTPLSTYLANLQILTTLGLSTGSVVLVGVHPTNPAGASNMPADWRAAIKGMAVQNGCAHIDLYSLFESYSTSLPFYRDNGHLLATGYAEIGRHYAHIFR